MVAEGRVNTQALRSRSWQRLVWCPGQCMHASWWQALDLAAWRAPYHQAGAVHGPVDRHIVALRGHDADMVRVIERDESNWLDGIFAMPRFALALGLVQANYLDCLIHKAYRQAFAPLLDDGSCHQLYNLFAAIRHRGENKPGMHRAARDSFMALPPAILGEMALRGGAARIAEVFNGMQLARCVELLFPAGWFVASGSSAAAIREAHGALQCIRRFL